MLEAVIFDFDGVIADTPKHYFKHMKHVLHKHNAKISDDEISHLVGFSLGEKLKVINKKYGLEIKLEEFVQNTQDSAKQDMYELLKFDKDLEALLKALEKKNVKMAIASNNSKKIIMRVLNSFEITHHFEAVVSGDDVKKYKPFPDVYINAAKLLGVRVSNSIGIEDTSVGLSAAHAAGLKTVVIPNEFASKHDFSKANLIVKSFNDLSVKKLEGLVK